MCAKPKLDEVPEGDWYCCICEQDRLVNALSQQMADIESHLNALKEAKQSSKRLDRISDIGTNLDTLFEPKSKSRDAKKPKYYENENDDPNEEDNMSESGMDKSNRSYPFEAHNKVNIFEDSAEPVGPRSCRVKKKITYTFEEYDRTINNAVGEKEVEDKSNQIINGGRIRQSKRQLRRSPSESEPNTDSSEEDEYSAKKRRDKCDSDEDFEIKLPRAQSRKKPARRVKRPRYKRDYSDNDNETEEEDEDEEDDESSEKSQVSSDEEEKIKRYNKLFAFEERRSSRNRRSLMQNYCETSDESEQEMARPVKKKKKLSSEDEDEESPAPISDDEEENDEKSLSTNHRASHLAPKKKVLSDEEEQEESTPKAKKLVSSSSEDDSEGVDKLKVTKATKELDNSISEYSSNDSNSCSKSVTNELGETRDKVDNPSLDNGGFVKNCTVLNANQVYQAPATSIFYLYQQQQQQQQQPSIQTPSPIIFNSNMFPSNGNFNLNTATTFVPLFQPHLNVSNNNPKSSTD